MNHDRSEILEPTARLWRVLGGFPIILRDVNNRKKYGLSKLYAAYNLLMFMACTGNFIYVLVYFDFYFSVNDYEIMTSSTSLAQSITSLTCLFSSNVWRTVRHVELSAIVNRMFELQKTLEEQGCQLDYELATTVPKVYTWTTLVASMILLTFDWILTLCEKKKVTLAWLLWNYGFIIQINDLTIFVTLVGLVGLQFRAINDKIRTTVVRANTSAPMVIVTSEVCAEHLRIISKGHYNVCALGKRINRMFDWVVVINVASGFVMLSTTLYYIIYEFQREGETNYFLISSYIHYELIHSLPTIIIVGICSWTSRQEMHAGKLIHEIRVKKRDSRLYEIIKSFSLQLHHQKIDFNAGGFFPLNTPLLQTMFGTITTYLVILIQFRPKLE